MSVDCYNVNMKYKCHDSILFYFWSEFIVEFDADPNFFNDNCTIQIKCNVVENQKYKNKARSLIILGVH